MAVVRDLDRPWKLTDPGRDHTLVPNTDADSTDAVDRAVTWLVSRRAPMWLRDPGPRVSCLVSLALEADSLLYDAVADARDAGYSWDQVSYRLGVSVRVARRRYADYTRLRATLSVDPSSSDCESAVMVESKGAVVTLRETDR